MNNIGSTFARVAEELHQQYLLAFAPAALDGKTHILDVRVATGQSGRYAREGAISLLPTIRPG